jgi:geranylgeranyl diphosphate synthase type II
MSLDFKQVLAEKKQLVWPEIRKYLKLPLYFSGPRKIPQKYRSLIDFHQGLIADYPERKGKYIRPTLLLLTCEAMGGSYQKAIKTAAAMQVSEDWILNHDDIEDDSEQRRGRPCLHHLYGIPLALNAGDGLHTVMWRILWDNLDLLGKEKTLAVVEEFYQMMQRTVFGQTVEIKWTQENRENLTDNDCFFIIDGKTVYYSIAGPMRLGAIIAGATQSQLEAIYEFAQPLGRCFQIKDDLLDLTSNFAGLKKQIGNDIYEGKRTLMLVHLLRNVKGKDKKNLEEIIKKKREEKSKKEVEWVISLMEKYGSLEYGQRKAKELAKKAIRIFEQKLGFLSCQPARDQLRAGIDFILKRNY